MSDQPWKVGVVVVTAVVFANSVQQSTVVVVVAAMVGCMLLSTLQPTKDLFAFLSESVDMRAPVGRVLKPKKSSSGKGRKGVLQKTQHENALQNDSEDVESDDTDSDPEGIDKMMLMKAQRKALRQKLSTKKLSARKAGNARVDSRQAEQEQAAASVELLNTTTCEVVKPISLDPNLDPRDKKPGNETTSLEDAIRGVNKFMELEKRSRAIDRTLQNGPPGSGGVVPRSSHSHLAKAHAHQAMMEVLKCIKDVRRLQQCGAPPAQHFDYLKPMTPITTSAPPGLEFEQFQTDSKVGLNRFALSATARPFAPTVMMAPEDMGMK